MTATLPDLADLDLAEPGCDWATHDGPCGITPVSHRRIRGCCWATDLLHQGHADVWMALIVHVHERHPDAAVTCSHCGGQMRILDTCVVPLGGES